MNLFLAIALVAFSALYAVRAWGIKRFRIADRTAAIAESVGLLAPCCTSPRAGPACRSRCGSRPSRSPPVAWWGSCCASTLSVDPDAPPTHLACDPPGARRAGVCGRVRTRGDLRLRMTRTIDGERSRGITRSRGSSRPPGGRVDPPHASSRWRRGSRRRIPNPCPEPRRASPPMRRTT